MQYWYGHGVPKQKMNLGLALYGRSFSLANPGNNSLGAPIINGGRPGLYTRERGFLAYYEVLKGILYFNFSLFFTNNLSEVIKILLNFFK